MTDTEIAWVAGLFEGEGTISFYKKSMVRMSVEMTDKDVIEKLFALAGGYLSGPRFRPDRKPIWTWLLGNRDEVKKLLEKLMPYFGERRKERAINALARLQTNTRPKKAVCGTPAGYQRHLRNKEPTCDSCREAHRKINNANYHKNKGKIHHG